MPDLIRSLTLELNDLDNNAKDLRSLLTQDLETHAGAELLLLLASTNEKLADVADRIRSGDAIEAANLAPASCLEQSDTGGNEEPIVPAYRRRML